jgi:hypothetical protein
MGTGRSGIPKGVTRKNLKGDLRVRAKSLGYELKMSDATVRKYKGALDPMLEELRKFQAAMRETDDMITGAGGTLSVRKLSYSLGGQTNASGEVVVNSLYMSSPGELLDTLPHEHTHNLVHTLITKELGFKPGSSEFYKAYTDAVIEHTINQEALVKYKNYMRRVIDREISKATAQIGNRTDSVAQFMMNNLKAERARIQNLTIEEAAKNSGMRSYATRQYPWAPKGHYIEMPTVATEMFHKSGYNFRQLLKTSPYSFFVMQTLYSRLHRGGKKK